MTDPRALYQELILEHNKKPRNYGRLACRSHHAVGHNPLCGDHIDVELDMGKEPGCELAGGCIEGIAFEGAACAICQSSASMMTLAVKGKTRSEAEIVIAEFLAMATGKLALADAPHLGRLRVFSGIRDLPVRVKCAILPWHTLHAALNAKACSEDDSGEDGLATATTEARS
ncbi:MULTISPECIES: Fe-S cluster assembly sulfur transfer protein SufU [unclassified Undibacterium]|uniref:Fe-S cluster assembly sulfur transfer protein SufU n=1 Tax=unclassified Undibacterium TaxID=2630295 RepID=UPI002AC8FDEE|nr:MULTISPECIES: SUF system NifU family Fe-S cluster assembly protein [unclassified Undibacterium]MEB0138521.1 SUF system NifU family Fe-S cluster assembly protein [Undibacterium sp. CCC2.1]MEB0173078.1 SUF system NifU family Fe-S cluster assembly protein [Undibacterium sp. CCC1.1]MEB0176130.1 SUF system NifU family Fe-S cluster assembly protein [Undibacterium sp. CCC3.4]MEB0215396.1 SUF system NifU family Fe-S cluster assembly protein [Undibacterium sp. 5I2]WPX42737.1 SUF system NifU family F